MSPSVMRVVAVALVGLLSERVLAGREEGGDESSRLDVAPEAMPENGDETHSELWMHSKLNPIVKEKTFKWIDKLDEETLKQFTDTVRAKMHADPLTISWLKDIGLENMKSVGDWKKQLTNLYTWYDEGADSLWANLKVTDSTGQLVWLPFLNAVFSTAQEMRKADPDTA